jgi:hypothetical protein
MLFRSKTSNVVLAKVWGSVLCAGFALLIVGSGFSIRRCLLALPLVVFFGFTASLASLELRDGILRYRRLFKWSIIPDGAIVDARIEWPPVIGSAVTAGLQVSGTKNLFTIPFLGYLLNTDRAICKTIQGH